MSDSAKTIIKYFCDRFLELDYYPNSIKAILDLKLDKLKNLTTEELKELKKKKITQIRDFADLPLKKFKALSEKLSVEQEKLNNMYIASLLISNSWNKRKVYLKKAQMKVVIAGLDFAGKTTLINRLIHNKTYYNLINLKPTVGANVEEFKSDKLNLVIWDLGGQAGHIEEYLDDPEKYFIQIDLLIFVVDAQDDVRYDEAIKYLQDILNILEYLDEIPFILVLLNKADSDLINDPDFQIKLEYLKDKIFSLIKSQDVRFNFDIVSTSIFNMYVNEPEIAKSIKSIFSKPSDEIKESKIPEIDKKVQKILDINLKFMDKVFSEIGEIKRLLVRLSPPQIFKNIFEIPFQSLVDQQTEVKEDENVPSQGIPKPLQFVKKNENAGTKQMNEELSSAPLSSLSGGVQDQTLSSTPSNSPDLKNLNPPPPPPPTNTLGVQNPSTSTSQPRDAPIGGGMGLRMNMLSELKQLFIKRGIANQDISLQSSEKAPRSEKQDLRDQIRNEINKEEEVKRNEKGS
ncbi:MAG: hypothetical protein BAJALOKI1v1_30013 [Promethearchaeota archaeon]|nr:MAG: hypothetical protein BAJALOKI1v1_30013 [Candidatus Lokiarchaeota archaeon]